MPFIRGKFYANPIAGQALEAAREAEQALNDSTEPAQQDDREDPAVETETADAPFRRIEIHATELVPAHTGNGQKGYVARIYRNGSTDGEIANSREAHVFYEPGKLLNFVETEVSRSSTSAPDAHDHQP